MLLILRVRLVTALTCSAYWSTVSCPAGEGYHPNPKAGATTECEPARCKATCCAQRQVWDSLLCLVYNPTGVA